MRIAASFRNKPPPRALDPRRSAVRAAVDPQITMNMMECLMRSKLLTCVAVLAVTAPAILATGGPASAQRWHGHRGFGVAGFAAGALIGGAAAAVTQPWWGPGYGYGYGYGYDGYYPSYAYDPGYVTGPAYAYAPDYDQSYAYGAGPTYARPAYAAPGRDDAYCAQRYRSYDPASGTYLGFDGVRHSCP
jgi:BA14K-like protein